MSFPPLLALSLCVIFPVVLLASLAGCRLMIARGPRDVPDGTRKLQTQAMPTSGGVGFAVPVILGSALLVWAFSFLLGLDGHGLAISALLAGSLAALGLGLTDDVRSLPAKLKLAVQVVIALAMAAGGVRVESFDLARLAFDLPLVLAIAGSAGWLVVLMNAVNFMDGADGMSIGPGVIMATALAILSALTGDYTVTAMAALFAVAGSGFLYFNLRGKLFAGDAGALFTGAFLGGLVLIFIHQAGVSVWTGPLLAIAFLADVFLTLIWRARRGKNLMQPHTDHIYQIMLRAGLSHRLTASIYVWVGVHGAFAAGAMMMFPIVAGFAGFAVLTGILVLISTRIRASAQRNGFL